MRFSIYPARIHQPWRPAYTMSAKPAVCVVDDDEAHRNALKLLFRSKNIPYLAFCYFQRTGYNFGSRDNLRVREDQKQILEPVYCRIVTAMQQIRRRSVSVPPARHCCKRSFAHVARWIISR